MRALRQKAGSQRGASITFALLLFLVCAVISSVVIVAATAVSGRASKMAEMDQRYYAVNSAAELLRTELEAPTVVVTTGTETVSTVDQDGNTVASGTSSALPVSMTLNETPTSDNASLVTAAALIIAGQTATLPTSLSLTATGMEALSVTLTPSYNKTSQVLSDETGDKLYINISNTDNAKGVYTLQLTFKADITRNVNKHTTYGAITPTLENGKYTRQKTVEETKVTTVRWKMIDMQTVVAPTPTTKPEGGT